ncbi:MAG: hypothetical protein RQ750_13780, partial [Roseovarius sp.]|nr:hypothetical protein [Roseovarius sp.]
MSQIDELEARITAALDRIAQGLEARQDAGPEGAGDDVAALKQQLADEKLANAQLEERVKTLRDKLAAVEAANEAGQSEQSQAMRKLDTDLQSLRKANQQLRDNNKALREANQVGELQPTTLVSFAADVALVFDGSDAAALARFGATPELL